MTRIFLQHEVSKGYLALVHGAPENNQGEIRSFLARSRRENRVKSVEKGGKEAITRFKIVEDLINYSLLNVEILTGRSHQIRAHMAEQNCPLVGDERYGGSSLIAGMKISRPLLHAEKLEFHHPVLNKDMDFVAPVPDDMLHILNTLRKSPYDIPTN